jgi:hypothetical protein
MTLPACHRVSFVELTDYAAGALTEGEAAALEEHLFSCGDCAARAAELDALAGGIAGAARRGEIDGFISDAVLNRLSRDGVRVRTFALSPGAIVPCAVWEGDELMVLRLRGDFGDATEVTLVQRHAGTEVSRTTTARVPGAHGEAILATSASLVRQLPEIELELELSSSVNGEERPVGRYTLVHGGAFRR